MDARVKAAAVEALSRFTAVAGVDRQVSSRLAARQQLSEVVGNLRARLDAAEGYPNPAFNGLAEATARALLLYDRHGDMYARLLNPICRTEDECYLDSLAGLARLDSFTRALADDHNFGLDLTGAIAVTDDLPLTPRALLSLLNTLDPVLSRDLAGKEAEITMTTALSKHPFEITPEGLKVNGRLRMDSIVVTLDAARLPEATAATNARFAGIFEMAESQFGPIDQKRYNALIDSFVERMVKTAATVEEPVRRAPAMNPQLKAFVEVLHSETGTSRAHAVTLTETLGDLAAKHKRLCHIDLDVGLTAEQDRARDAIESELRAATADLKGVTRVSFNYDPRGLTVAIKFNSGVYDTWTDGGSMGVPVDPARLKALETEAFWEPYVETADREFAQRLGEVGVADAERLAGRLQELTTAHTKLCEIASMQGLSEEQDEAKHKIREVIRSEIAAHEGIKGVEFGADSRYATVRLELASDRSNIMGGGWVVPVDNELYSALDDGREFWTDYLEAAKPADGFVRVSIDETGNAAFVDCGCDQEIARIIDAAADKVASWGVLQDAEAPLFDLNGNRVGSVAYSREPVGPVQDIPEGSVRLLVHETGHAAFDGDSAAPEVERILRDAAERVRAGERTFDLRDINGNLVGTLGWNAPEPPMPSEDTFLRRAFDEDRVYMADGIEDGEFCLVVTHPEFTPGYHQGQGIAWLVNAAGELASGYDEDGDIVREVHLRDLRRTEREVLQDLMDGKLTAQEVTRRFVPKEEDLEP